MARQHPASTRQMLEAASHKARRQKYVLRLYVAGFTLRSREALRTVVSICEEELAGRCDLKVIDIYAQPALASEAQIVAVPTLVKKLPVPLRKFIGSMIDRERLLAALDLCPRGA